MMDLLKSYNLYALFVVILFFGCKEKSVSQIIENRISGPALGTTYNLIYLSDEEIDFQVEIDSVFKVINQSLSTYIPTSDISKINNGDTTLVVDAMFQEVFQLSKEITQQTNGYFDPTVGTLVNAWGFGPGKQIQLDSAKVDSLLQYVGFDKVKLAKENTIQKNKNIKFDFNAIAKGYAIDRLALMFDENGIENYLLEVGGEVVAKGENKLKQKKWTAGVNDPNIVDRMAYRAAIYLKDAAMASSGNYRHFRTDEKTGKKYVHTVNPKTGYTKNSNVLGATVIADNCAKADGYATAFMAMDLSETKKTLKNTTDLEVYIVYLNDKGETQDFMTDGFKTILMD